MVLLPSVCRCVCIRVCLFLCMCGFKKGKRAEEREREMGGFWLGAIEDGKKKTKKKALQSEE